MLAFAILFLYALKLFGTVFAQDEIFELANSYVGHQFFDAFEWFTDDDPTNGRVNYVSMSEAIDLKLSYATDDTFIMRADSSTTLNSTTPRGRNSVRITSQAAWADSVIVLDLNHMPEGCATWPAFWTLSQQGPWPQGGEIDIIEGVNKQVSNIATLHTTPNCTMPIVNGTQLGTWLFNNCDTTINGNEGCGVQFPQQSSYGAGLNSVGGGWYAMKRTTQGGVWVWFWARGDPWVPLEIKYNFPAIVPDESWGEPSARFIPTQCDMATHFNSHNIIFDLTFCGDYAGALFPTSGCSVNASLTCNDYVNNNPTAFNNAYWVVNSLRVYTPVQY